MPLMSDKAWKLCQNCGGSVWDQHPTYLREDWAQEAHNGDTIIGYWDWVISQIEQAEDEEEGNE